MTLLLVALIAIVLAAATSAIAWNRSHDERRRRDARIAALAAEIHDEPVTGPLVGGSAGDLFATRPQARSGSRYAAVAAVGLLVCGSVAALAVVSSTASSEATVRSEPAVAAAEPRRPAEIVPIELVALGHEREGDRLTVRGVVRNPSSGVALDRVIAVVLVYKDDGGFAGSGRATVDSSTLGPGGETAFTVTIPAASHVGRYRVSFRTEDRVVPHVDRRGRAGN